MLMCRECGRTYPVAEGFCPMDGTPLSDAASADPMEDGRARLGEVLDRRYRIDEIIGDGGMAHVYRVTHTMIGKSLAAKVIRHELRHDEEVIRRFLREAQIVSSIKHPNVVDVSDYGEMPEGGAFCVMELLRGSTLAEAIDTHGRYAPEDALHIALQLCQGLHHSHETGVVHRDLKPQNIFVCDPKNGKDPVVKLIDFGVARAGNRITVAGAVLGTPEYMSPEQVRGDPVDAGADLYALGVILFELLTAAVPYRSDDVAVTMQSHLHAPTPAMSLVDPDLAYLVETQALIERLMEKDRTKRPGTAAEVGVLLQQAMTADLGREATERVVRSTLAIGSGDIVKAPALPPSPAAPWSDRQMGWNPELQSSAQPSDPPSNDAAPSTDEVDPLPPTRGRSLPWIMAATAMVVAGATIGAYAAMGGFRAQTAPASAAPTVEIVSAPVPPAPADTQTQAAAPGGKSPAVEHSPAPGASTPAPEEESTAQQGEVEAQTENAEDEASRKRQKRTPRQPVEKRRPRKKKPRKDEQDHDDAPASPPEQTPTPVASPPSTPTDPPTAPKQDGDLRNPFG